MYTQQNELDKQLTSVYLGEILTPPTLPPEPHSLSKSPTYIGQYLYTLRGKQSISRVAQALSFSPAIWARIEGGQQPSLLTLIHLHHAMHIPYDILLSLIERDLAEGLYKKNEGKL